MEDYQKVNQMEEQLRTLENQFEQLCRITENLQQKVLEQEQTNQLLVRSNQQLIEWMDGVIRDINLFQNNARYEFADPRLQNEETWYPQIQEVEESVQDIILNHKSLCRFGDGEFATIDGVSRHHFQTIMNPELSKRLEEVLHSADENILIAIANNYGNLEAYTEQAKREIRAYMTKEIRYQHMKLLQKDRMYVDTYITRPYMMYIDKNTKGPKERFSLLQKLWEKRDCILVEGEYSRLGVGNDLFANASSVQRVLCPAENAYEKYDEILAYCKQLPAEVLYLIALGPTATVLAYDLAKSGRQALDIGHVDLEYEWFLRGIEHREVVVGKYTNECNGGDVVQEVEEPEYKKEVIHVIR